MLFCSSNRRKKIENEYSNIYAALKTTSIYLDLVGVTPEGGEEELED